MCIIERAFENTYSMQWKILIKTKHTARQPSTMERTVSSIWTQTAILTCADCWYFTTMKTKNKQRSSLYKLAEYLFQLCLRVYMHITYFTVKCFVLKACVSFIHRSFAFYACPGKGFYGSTSIPSFQHSFVLSPCRQ